MWPVSIFVYRSIQPEVGNQIQMNILAGSITDPVDSQRRLVNGTPSILTNGISTAFDIPNTSNELTKVIISCVQRLHGDLPEKKVREAEWYYTNTGSINSTIQSNT